MRKLRVVSLFTGAGGLDFGFEAAGFTTCVAVDNDSDCCSAIKSNRPWPVIEKNIQQVSSKELLQCGSLGAGEVDLLIGGPPCQPFSKAGYWASGSSKRLQDPRADTLRQYMRCVADLLPEAFLLENVHGINYSGKEEGFHLLEELIQEINRNHGVSYQFSWKIVNAADYGVPQLRKRFFLVAHRDGKEFIFPNQTHKLMETDIYIESTAIKGHLAPYVTSWDAISGLTPTRAEEENLKMKGRWADLLPSIPEGENYLWHTNRKGGLPLFGWRTRYWSFLLKLAKNLPSWTIQAQPGPAIGPFHWDNRLLSVREMARLQTFPENVEFIGSRNSVQKQIGNAVPSLLSEILAREITIQFFNGSFPEPLKLAISLRRPIPPASAVQPVPEKYWHLIGEHPDHPGTGKGPLFKDQANPENTYNQSLASE